MDQATQDYFRERLLQERQELKERLTSVDGTGLAAPMRDSLGELSLYDNHPADVATELFERSKDLALRDAALMKLKAIENALARMATGCYGYCEVCGAAIPRERLEAVPYTTMCYGCKEKQEEREGSRVRPIEEGVLLHPWATPGDEVLAYDQEDTWQDVAQHSLATETEPLEEESRGTVTGVDDLPYCKSRGVYYRDFRVYRGKPRGTG